MSQKRRDSKKRVLRDRESQCKDGRYRYSYLLRLPIPQMGFAP